MTAAIVQDMPQSVRRRGFTKHWPLVLAAAFALSIFLAAEVGVRLAGVMSYPLYADDPQLGYLVRPSQAGSFLNKRHWRFNDLGMGAAPFTGGGDLLVGDSIVLGGNPIDEPDKLGPQLESRLHHHVWPISAGSWSLINELTWLRLHPDVVQHVDRIVFVTNSDDFLPPSVWRSELTHPRSYPLCATCYLAVRQLAPQSPPAAKREGDWKPALRAFAAGYHRPITFALYPKRGESPQALRQREAQLKAEIPQAQFIEVATDPRWSRAAYRDDMHPTAAGYHLLGQIVAARLGS